MGIRNKCIMFVLFIIICIITYEWYIGSIYHITLSYQDCSHSLGLLMFTIPHGDMFGEVVMSQVSL